MAFKILVTIHELLFVLALLFWIVNSPDQLFVRVFLDKTSKLRVAKPDLVVYAFCSNFGTHGAYKKEQKKATFILSGGCSSTIKAPSFFLKFHLGGGGEEVGEFGCVTIKFT